ncbi:MAG: ABC transporter permease, partial [Spirochaetota bacterium]
MYRYFPRSFLLSITALVLMLVLMSIMDIGFVSIYNIRNILRWTGLFGLLSLGVAIVIITGGIDLSVGSVVALIGGLCVYNLTIRSYPVALVIGGCLLLAAMIGIIHGIFIAILRIQPFVVTLCGLFVFRGLVRYAMGDITLGYGSRFTGLKLLSSGRFPELLFPQGTVPEWISRWSLPMPFLILLVVGLFLHLFLRHTVYGQYLQALGSNEAAVVFTGVSPVGIKIAAYAISSRCAGLAGILFSLDLNSVQPSTAGSMYELYAIAGCVVGGLSLKGGEGSIARVILGTGIVRVLYNVISIAGISTVLESTLIGVV